MFIDEEAEAFFVSGFLVTSESAMRWKKAKKRTKKKGKTCLADGIEFEQGRLYAFTSFRTTSTCSTRSKSPQGDESVHGFLGITVLL